MSLVAISADSLEEGLEFVLDDGIDFPIASDIDGETTRDWGLSEEGKDRSVPAAFLVDERRVIRFSQVGESMSDRVDLDELLDALDRL